MKQFQKEEKEKFEQLLTGACQSVQDFVENNIPKNEIELSLFKDACDTIEKLQDALLVLMDLNNVHERTMDYGVAQEVKRRYSQSIAGKRSPWEQFYPFIELSIKNYLIISSYSKTEIAKTQLKRKLTVKDLLRSIEKMTGERLPKRTLENWIKTVKEGEPLVKNHIK